MLKGRCASVCMAMCMAVTTLHATTIDSSEMIEKTIMATTRQLENAINSSYEKAKEETKDYILENKVDYYMTMESFNRQDNPYKDMNYLEIIAAYIVAKENTQTLKKSTFYDLPFIGIEIEEVTTQEYIPMKVQTYIQEGNYYVKGKQTFIDKPTEVERYKKIDNGKYLSNGKEMINPNLKEVTFGEVKLKAMSAEDILSYYGLEKEYIEMVESKCSMYEKVLNPVGVSESVFLETSKEVLSEDARQQILKVLQSDITGDKKNLITTAVSLVGKVPYQWGGKAEAPGYDRKWWSIGGDGKQRGLDCSGYVQWSYMSAGFSQDVYEKLISTSSILKNTETISQEELEPGDMGLLNNGDSLNHVGIYLGDGYYIHCSSEKKTVVVEQTQMFKIFKKMPVGVGGSNNSKEGFIKYNNDLAYTDSDVYLLGQLIYNEANGEGINGWIAVAEVVKNRLDSEYFPNTLEEVIYAKGQFSDSDKIKTRVPTESQLMVAEEVLKGNMLIFGNKDVLYFRNAGGSTQDWGKFPFYTSINNHQFYTQNKKM